MSSLLSAEQWNNYRAAMRAAHDTFAQKVVTWCKIRSKLNRFGEDNNVNGYDKVELQVLLNYNYMRSWPITFRTETGGSDRQSVQILINKDYLRELGYINQDNYFTYNPTDDLLIIDGLVHEFAGDTPAGQMQDDDVTITFIVKRKENYNGPALSS